MSAVLGRYLGSLRRRLTVSGALQLALQVFINTFHVILDPISPI